MKNFRKNWLRHLIQWGTIIAIVIFLTKVFGNETADPEAYCPFGGIQTFATYLVAGSMACSMTATQIMMGVVLAIGVILFSKLFCGYLCPLGWATEYLAVLRKKLKVKELVIRSGSIADRALRLFKYVLLFWIFYMTVTSSELFCKNFDPYYAFGTGFKGELTMWMAIISIAVFFLGNFFVKMFWCKYLCPLGALSNIFKFAITFVALVAAYALFDVAGLSLSWVYLLAAATVLGWLWEIIYLEAKVFPLLKVVRSTEKCNDCGLCAKKCPYSINVDKVGAVKHVDCNLCGECIASCNQDALTFGGKKAFRWVPAILTAVLFFTALYLGSTMELATIDVKWGDEAKHENLETLKIEGLRSVTCYGSSMAFKAKLEKIPGVYRVATFVKHSYANVYYNPAEVTEDKIREEIYVPSKFKINTPPADVKEIKVITIYTEKMYDRMDPNYLGMQFRNSGKGYYGLETEYSCPLTVRLYMDMNEPVDEKFFESMVEMKELQMPVHGGGVRTVEVDYEYIGMAEGVVDTVSRIEFLRRQFTNFSVNFKSNQEKWGGQNEAVYEIIYPGLDKPLITRNLPYLSNHLSQIDGFLSIETLVNDNEEYCIHITYSKDVLDEEKIWEAITRAKWNIKDREGVVTEQDAKLTFEEKGKTL
ncbi:MAG: 4Fe-4S binding protein [Rikenellaceae bacterium]|nr:4Fe-4S binding protein [Rikenellaceae bacterium]